MQMMPVLEPQDQTSVLVIRVIGEVLVLVGTYLPPLRLVRSHFEQNADIIIIISSSLYLIKQVNRRIHVF